jgi:hypothetical protein
MRQCPVHGIFAASMMDRVVDIGACSGSAIGPSCRVDPFLCFGRCMSVRKAFGIQHWIWETRKFTGDVEGIVRIERGKTLSTGSSCMLVIFTCAIISSWGYTLKALHKASVRPFVNDTMSARGIWHLVRRKIDASNAFILCISQHFNKKRRF